METIQNVSQGKIGIGPRLHRKKIEVSQDLVSESVVPQVVDEILAVDEISAVDGSQLKTTERTQKLSKPHLNLGAQAVGAVYDKSSHVTITGKKGDNLRVSKRKKNSP